MQTPATLAWLLDAVEADTPLQAADLLDTALEALTVAQLRERAAALGWSLKGTRRPEILEQLAAFYRSPDAARVALERLRAPERRLLQFATVASYVPFPELVTAVAGLNDALGPERQSREVIEQSLRLLVERGYLLDVYVAGQRSVFVPSAFQSLLRPLADAAPPLPKSPQRAGLHVQPAGDPIGALLLLWTSLRARRGVSPAKPFPPDVTLSHPDAWPFNAADSDARRAWNDPTRAVLVPRAHPPLPADFVGELARRLGASDSRSVAFFGAVAVILGLAERKGTQLVANEERTQQFFRLSPLEQRRLLLAAWSELPYGTWDEISVLRARIPALELRRRAIHWQFGQHAFNQDLADLRLTVVGQLGFLDLEGWRDVRAWLRLLGRVMPQIVHTPPKATTTPWFLAWSGQPLDPESPEGWSRGSEVVLAFMLEGPLTWLGLIETATGPKGDLAAFRLTPWGLALLHDGPVPAPPPVPAPAWNDDLTVELPLSGAVVPVVGALAGLGEMLDSTPGRLRFRFTAERAADRFASGMRPADLAAEFEAAGAPLPPAVADALERWWARWGLVRRYPGLSVIELADEYLARELLSNTSLARIVVYQLDARHLVVAADGLDDLVAELEQRGYYPTVVEAP